MRCLLCCATTFTSGLCPSKAHEKLVEPRYWPYTIWSKWSSEKSQVESVGPALRWRSHLKFTLDKAYELLVAHQVSDAAHDHGHHGPAPLLCMVIDVLLPVLVSLRRRWLGIALRLIPCRLPCALQCTSQHSLQWC